MVKVAVAGSVDPAEVKVIVVPEGSKEYSGACLLKRGACGDDVKRKLFPPLGRA